MPLRRKPPKDRSARVAKRVSAARQEATGISAENSDDSGSSSCNSSESDNDVRTNSDDDEDHVDEKLALENFKDECWNELNFSSLEDDIANLTGSNKSDVMTKSENIIVGFRIRPSRNNDDENGPAVVSRGQEVRISHPTSNGSKDKHKFAFDFSFGGKSTQFDVFRDLGWPCLRNAWQGFNVSIFAYGQTGSGKSHSMMGTPANPGLVRNVANYLFDFLDRTMAGAIGSGYDVKSKVSISCLEIYNEQIRDILAPFVEKSVPSKAVKPLRGGVFSKGAKAIGVKSAAERSSNLRIRETGTKGVYVEGLCSMEVLTEEEMSRCIAGATANREVRATKMNDESSRSHLIFMIELENSASGNSSGKRGSTLVPSTFGKTVSKKSKLNLIDLAGSERSKATGATGESLKEGANINKSLSTLGRVIAALSDPKASQLAPFRDSKLTYILKDALAGNARSSMLATAHPSALYYEETLSTLRYASSVKRIKTSATMNAEAAAEDIISELRAEVVKLSTQLLTYQSGRPSPLVRRSSKEARRRPPPKRSSLSLKLQKVGVVAPDGTRDEIDQEEDNGAEGSGIEEEEDDSNNEPSLDTSSTTQKSKKGNWLSRQILQVGRNSAVTDQSHEDAERDLELAAILCERDELDLQLGLRNKERVGLELQLKAKARELGKLEGSLESQEAEVDDLAFALEASNTENRLLHDEIARLKRRSRVSSTSIGEQVRDPQAFIKDQVMSALSSYQQVRNRNDTKLEDHGRLRRQMLQSQKDPAAVVESLATNMGFWLLGQANEGESDGLSETLGLIAEANQRAASSGSQIDSESMKALLKDSVKQNSKDQLEALRAQLAESDLEKEKMEAQLELTSSHVADLSTNMKDFSKVRVELEEKLAAQQILIQSALKVMHSRNLDQMDDWLRRAKILNLEHSHEAHSINRLRVTVAEEAELLVRLQELALEVEEEIDKVPPNRLDELNHMLAVAASRALTPEAHPVVQRAFEARKNLQRREDAVATLELAMRSNEIDLLKRALNEALSDSVSLSKQHPVVLDALDTINHLTQVVELESRLTVATGERDLGLLLEVVANAEALGLTVNDSGALQSAVLTLERMKLDMVAKQALAEALESGSLDRLQNAVESASKAGVDFETCEAASAAANLVAKQTSVAAALRGAIASRSLELLEEASVRGRETLAHPAPPLSPSSSFASAEAKSFGDGYETSLKESLARTDETISAGRTNLEGLLFEADELLVSLRTTAAAEANLEAAVQGRSLKALQSAIVAAEEAGVGVSEPSGLLHTGRILCTRMEAEASALTKLVAAVHLGSDISRLKEAINEATMMGLRGPEVAAAQAVMLELGLVQKLRVAIEEQDITRLTMIVPETRDILNSANLSNSQHESQTSKHVANFVDSGKLLGPGGELEALRNISPPKGSTLSTASAKHHYALTSVAAQVFNDHPLENENRQSLTALQKKLEEAETILSETSSLAKEKRESEAKLAVAMLDPNLVEQQFDSLTNSLAETAALLEELMGMKVVLESLEERLPKDLLTAFSTGAFVTSCNERYDELATGGDEDGLTPDELFPVILEMTQNAPWEITWEQCVKFADIFDADGNGVIDRSEFVGFSKFMIIGSLLESMAEIGDTLRNRSESQGGEIILSFAGLSAEDLIERVKRNTSVVEELLPMLPEDIYNYLSGPDFIKACQTKFDETDVDGSGDLDPSELVPIILEISKQHQGDISPDRAEEFCKVFDDDGNGVLDRIEFVSLHRFVVMMVTLEAATTNDVRRHPAAVQRFDEEELVAMTQNNTAANATTPAPGLEPEKEKIGPIKPRKLSVLFTDVPPGELPSSQPHRKSLSASFHKPDSPLNGDVVRPPLKKTESMRAREAAEAQARSLRREMVEASERIDQIDAEVETLLVKFDSSEEKIGQGLMKRKSWKSEPEPQAAQTPATSSNLGGLFGAGTIPKGPVEHIKQPSKSRPSPIRKTGTLTNKNIPYEPISVSDSSSDGKKRGLKNSSNPKNEISQNTRSIRQPSPSRQKSPARHLWPKVVSDSTSNPPIQTVSSNGGDSTAARARPVEDRTDESISNGVVSDKNTKSGRPTIKRVPQATIRSPRASSKTNPTRPTRAPSPAIRRPSSRSASEGRGTIKSQPRSRSSSNSRSSTSSASSSASTSSSISSSSSSNPSTSTAPSTLTTRTSRGTPRSAPVVRNTQQLEGREGRRGRSVGRSESRDRGKQSRSSSSSSRVLVSRSTSSTSSSSPGHPANTTSSPRVITKPRPLSSKLAAEPRPTSDLIQSYLPSSSRQSQSMPRQQGLPSYETSQKRTPKRQFDL